MQSTPLSRHARVAFINAWLAAVLIAFLVIRVLESHTVQALRHKVLG